MRRCSEPGCLTLLNGWNPGPECWAHQPRIYVRQEEVLKECRECSRWFFTVPSATKPRCPSCRFSVGYEVFKRRNRQLQAV